MTDVDVGSGALLGFICWSSLPAAVPREARRYGRRCLGPTLRAEFSLSRVNYGNVKVEEPDLSSYHHDARLYGNCRRGLRNYRLISTRRVPGLRDCHSDLAPRDAHLL